MKLLVKQATKEGWIEMCVPGVCDLSYPQSKLRRGRVQGGGTISPTITTTMGVCKVIPFGRKDYERNNSSRNNG